MWVKEGFLEGESRQFTSKGKKNGGPKDCYRLGWGLGRWDLMMYAIYIYCLSTKGDYTTFAGWSCQAKEKKVVNPMTF